MSAGRSFSRILTRVIKLHSYAIMQSLNVIYYHFLPVFFQPAGTLNLQIARPGTINFENQVSLLLDGIIVQFLPINSVTSPILRPHSAFNIATSEAVWVWPGDESSLRHFVQLSAYISH